MSHKAGSLGVIVSATLLVVLGACSTTEPIRPSPGPELAVGDQAPGFSLPDARGGTVSLEEELVDRPALLYFSMGPG